MNKENFRLLLKNYLGGTCTEEERRVVDQWYELLGEESFQQPSKQELDLIGDRLWNKIQAAGLHEREPVQARQKPAVFRLLQSRAAAAAALVGLLLIGCIYWFALRRGEPVNSGYADGGAMTMQRNETAQSLRIVLGDKTAVTLAPHASIRYLPAFEGSTREVYIEGEAFFDVFRDTSRPFFVYSGQLVTQVLGTSFRVKTQQGAERFEVSVVTGIVSVYERGQAGQRQTQRNGVILTPNQKVLYYAEEKHFITGLVDNPAPVHQLSKPNADAFTFNDAPLSAVLSRLEDAYQIRFVVENEALYHCPFTGDIGGQGLHNQLRLITQSIGASYEIQGTQILIKGEGCPRPA